MKNLPQFAHVLMHWYALNCRPLPWRDTHNPYFIWLSEIILQQTRVAQGESYYHKFVSAFPTVNDLAAASTDEVLRLWQGLGYYMRARNLHAAAQQIVAMGGFPESYEAVRKRSGVGTYTAAAICSFAFNQPYAVLDGNVYRVLARYFGIPTPIDSTEGKKLFNQLAQQMMDQEQPAIYNQAIMEFGALQCTPTSPHCVMCPLADSCAAHHTHMVSQLPVKKHRTKVAIRHFNYLFVLQQDYTYINKRTTKDIWQNLYELPLIETAEPLTLETLCCHPAFTSLLPHSPELPTVRMLQQGVKHMLTHQHLIVNFFEVILPCTPPSFGNYKRITLADIELYAMPQLIHRFLCNKGVITP